MKNVFWKFMLSQVLIVTCLTSNAQYLLKSGGTSPFIDYNGKLGIGLSFPSSKLHIKESTLGIISLPLLTIESHLNSTLEGKISFLYSLDGKKYGLYQYSQEGSGMFNFFQDPVNVNGAVFYGLDENNEAGISLSNSIGSFKFKLTPQSGPINTPLIINSNSVVIEDLLKTNTIRIVNGAGLNKVLVSDEFGNGIWTDLTRVPALNLWQQSSFNSNWIYTSFLRVGIQTESPGEALEIHHNDPTGGISINQTGQNNLYKSEIKFKLTGTEEWAIGSNTDQNDRKNFFIWNHILGKYAFWVDGNNGMTGIGTNWPSAELEVNGNFKATAIGIGINPPPASSEYKLWVEGGIAAREVKVTINDFPDYVFDENYKLMSLKDLDKYISSEKHLPGIPSANMVCDSNGVKLGEMQIKLLEKIEEQALYIIDLQKQIDELKKFIINVKEE